MKKTASSIKLSTDQLKKLTSIAATHKCHARTGPTSGNPSWRALVGDIADGRLRVKDPAAKWEPKDKKPKERKPFKAHPRFKPRWWEPTEMDDMKTETAVAASGYSIEELTAGGLVLVDDGKNLIAPSDWFGWAWKEAK
jgi:hypothetical protein